MAIAFRSESQDIANSSGTLTVAEPAGAAQNDLLLYLFIVDFGAVVTPPTGWTTIYTGNSSGSLFTYTVAYVVRGSSAPSRSWIFGASPYHEAYIVCFSGCHTTSPINANAQTAADAGTNPDPPSATATRTSCAAVAVGINWTGATTGGWTAPSGYTLIAGTASGNDGTLAYRLLAGGPEDPGPFGNAGGSDNRWSATILLAPLPTVPSVSTLAATAITPTTATGNGSVDDDGGATITTRGVCWSTSPQPTTSDSTATTSGTTGSYNVSLTGLSNNTTYHMRAYAINSVGTGYGPDVTFISNGGATAWLKQ